MNNRHLHHASEARRTPLPQPTHHPHHASVALNKDGSYDIAKLKAGVAFWMAEARARRIHFELVSQVSATAPDAPKITVLHVVRHIGHGPDDFDLDILQAGLDAWFAEIEAGRVKVLAFHEERINLMQDLLTLVREELAAAA